MDYLVNLYILTIMEIEIWIYRGLLTALAGIILKIVWSNIGKDKQRYNSLQESITVILC